MLTRVREYVNAVVCIHLYMCVAECYCVPGSLCPFIGACVNAYVHTKATRILYIFGVSSDVIAMVPSIVIIFFITIFFITRTARPSI